VAGFEGVAGRGAGFGCAAGWVGAFGAPAAGRTGARTRRNDVERSASERAIARGMPGD